MADHGTIYWGRQLLSFDGSFRSIDGGGVFVPAGGGRIAEVEPLAALRRSHPLADEVGGHRRVVMPGLIDAHQHGRALSAADLGVADQELELWLLEQRAMARVDPALSARLAAARALLGGVTTSLHPHVTSNPGTRLEEMVAVARAYADTGARVAFGIDVRDRASLTYEDDADLYDRLPAAVREGVRRALGQAPPPSLDELDRELAALRASTAGTLVSVGLAPRGPQWCTQDLLEWVAERLRGGTHVQMHCSETRAQYGWYAQHDDSPVRFLGRLGLLGRATTLAHCVWLADEDVRLLAESQAHVSHNPSSNLRLASGRAPVGRLREAGVAVAIGTDSVGLDRPPDLFAEVRLARWLEQAPTGRYAASAAHALQAALDAGAGAFGGDEPIGVLQAGAAADIVLLDLPTLETVAGDDGPDVHELVAARATREHVTDVVVAGRQLVRDGRFLPFDVAPLEVELRAQARANLPAPELRDGVAAVRPYVERELRRLHALTGSVSFAG